MPSPCDYFNRNHCRSCALIDRPYSEQLAFKVEKLLALLRQTLSQEILCSEPVAATPALGSRSKMKLAIGGKAAAPILGFVNQRGEVRELLHCPLHEPALNEIATAAFELLPDSGLTPYDVPTKSGELKYLLAQRAAAHGEIMLRLVLRSLKEREAAQTLVKELTWRFPRIVVSSINIQPEHKAIIEGPEEILLSTRRTIIDTIGDFEFEFSPGSFSQVTPHVAVKLYRHAADIIRARGTTRLLDLYSGVGAFSIFASPAIKEGYGVELSEAAVNAANANAARNGISHLHYISADVANFLGNNKDHYDAAIVNPPRSGLREAVISALLQRGIKTLLYSSCNPETLARDLKLLAARYRIESLTPFDMFPMTEHLEVLTELRLC